jgi:hypothetical protein
MGLNLIYILYLQVNCAIHVLVIKCLPEVAWQDCSICAYAVVLTLHVRISVPFRTGIVDGGRTERSIR